MASVLQAQRDLKGGVHGVLSLHISQLKSMCVCMFVISTGVYEVSEVGVGVGEHRRCPGVVHRSPEALRGLPQTLDDERAGRRAG